MENQVLLNENLEELSIEQINTIIGGSFKPDGHAGFWISSIFGLGGVYTLGYTMGYYQ